MADEGAAKVIDAGRPDRSTVSADGSRPGPRIAGVVVRLAVTQVDERGELCEILDSRWGFSAAAIVYAYQSTIRPRKTKGWIVHRDQEDRLFVSLGFLKFVLYDARPDSPSHGAIDEIYLSERNRGLLLIPRGVYHAVQNVGEREALFVNFPTQPYRHEQPDKYRLPLDTDLIPYSLTESSGG